MGKCYYHNLWCPISNLGRCWQQFVNVAAQINAMDDKQIVINVTIEVGGDSLIDISFAALEMILANIYNLSFVGFVIKFVLYIQV